MFEPITQEVIDSWNKYFERFDKEIYPKIFLSRGFTKMEAQMMWCANSLRNDIEALCAGLDNQDDENEGWKG